MTDTAQQELEPIVEEVEAEPVEPTGHAVARQGDVPPSPALERPEGQNVMLRMMETCLNDPDVPVEKLERVVDLYQRLLDRDARVAFARAMARFRAACPPIPKVRVAEVRKDGVLKYRYNFADLAITEKTIKPHLEDNGLSYTFRPSQTERMMKVECVVRHIDGHVEVTPAEMPLDSPSPGMSKQHATAGAQSMASRYALWAALGMVTTMPDNDGNPPPPTKDDPKITRDQILDLETLMKDAGVDQTRFLRWVKKQIPLIAVKTLADLPASKFDAICNAVRSDETPEEKAAKIRGGPAQ